MSALLGVRNFDGYISAFVVVPIERTANALHMLLSHYDR
jgi:hypothetical protein